MKTNLYTPNVTRILVILLLVLNYSGRIQATPYVVDIGYARFVIDDMNMTSTEVDPVYNPGKCNITIQVKGSIRNISNQTIWYLNFGTDARPNEGINSGLTNLLPNDTYTFNLTYTYSWLDCGSVNHLLVLGNAANINQGSIITEFEQQVLPVELIAFSFDQAARALTWETASEINNEGFSIEQSFDGEIWSEIGFQSGLGNTTKGAQYHFPLMKSNISGYYRLRQIDFDGQFEYSNIINVTHEVLHQEGWGKLFPNPAQDYLIYG